MIKVGEGAIEARNAEWRVVLFSLRWGLKVGQLQHASHEGPCVMMMSRSLARSSVAHCQRRIASSLTAFWLGHHGFALLCSALPCLALPCLDPWSPRVMAKRGAFNLYASIADDPAHKMLYLHITTSTKNAMRARATAEALLHMLAPTQGLTAGIKQ